MKEWRYKYQAEWMSSDTKPKGKILKKIQVAIRQLSKKLIRKQLREMREDGE